MNTERSRRRRASVLAMVGLAVMQSASSVHAEEGPASPKPTPPSWPSANNPSPPQEATGEPAPRWPDQQPGGGYPPPPGSYPPPPGSYPPPPSPHQESYGPPPPGFGYVRLPPPNVHDGLYLRLHLGFGFTSIEGKSDLGGEETISGGSVSLGVALGGTVAPNLVVFGTFMASIAEEPTVIDVDGSSFKSTGSAGLFGLGAGAAYYLQPLNLYLSGALVGVQVDLSDANDNTVYDSKFGLGFQGIVGKEWWVSSEWGLGVALEGILAPRMKDKNDSSLTWSGRAVNVLFSATYN